VGIFSGFCAINAKDIVVDFDDELDAETAEDLANYTIKKNNGAALATDGTAFTATIDATDKTKLNIVLTTPLANGDSVSLTVSKSVLNKDLGGLAEDVTKTLSFSDTAAPVVSKVEVSGTDLVVTFDEYVASVGLAKVDGTSVTVGAVTGKTVTLTGAATGLTAGTHTVAIGNATDIATPVNTATYQTKSFTISEDAAIPEVNTLTANGQMSFVVKFNKEVTAPTVTVKKSGFALNIVSVNPVDGGGTDDEYVVTVADAAPVTVYGSGESTATLSVTVSGYKAINNDMFGNSFANNVTLTKDTVAPTVVTRYSKIVDVDPTAAFNEGFHIQFSENLDALTLDPTKVILKDKDGVRLNPANITVSVENDANTNPTIVRVESTDVVTTGEINAGTYTVELAAGAIKDTAGNANAATSVNYTKSGTAPADIDLTGQISAAADTISINFGEDMTASATTLANYKIDNAALPTGTLIYFNGNKQNVEIKLPAGSIETNSDVLFSISNAVVSEDGSKVEATDLNTVLTGLVDNVKPQLVSAKKVSATSVELTFSEAMDTVADIAGEWDDFVISVNGVEVAATAIANGSSTNKLVLTVPTYNTAQTVVVKVADTADTVDDANSNVLVTGTEKTATN